MMSKLLTAQPTVKAIINFAPYRDGSRVLNGGGGYHIPEWKVCTAQLRHWVHILTSTILYIFYCIL